MVKAEAVLPVGSAFRACVASLHNRATDGKSNHRWRMPGPLLPPAGSRRVLNCENVRKRVRFEMNLVLHFHTGSAVL